MKIKSLNTLPSFGTRFALYCAIAVVVALGVNLFCLGYIKDAYYSFMANFSIFIPHSEVVWPGDEVIGIAILIIVLCIGAHCAYKQYSRFHNGAWLGAKPSKSNVHGSARLLSKPHTLKKAFSVWKKESKPQPGIVLGGIGSCRDKLLINTDKTHSLVLGGTGSGKTTSVLLLTLVELIESKTSFVALDPKGELFAITGQHAIDSGAKVYVIDFSDPKTSSCWLPLQPAIDCAQEKNGRRKEELPGEIRILADTLIPDQSKMSPIWTQAARILFSGLCMFVIESDSIPQECKNLSTVATLSFMPQDKLQEIVEKLDDHSAAYQSLSSIAYAPAETYGGFAVNLSTALSVYADPFISPFLSKSDFQIDDFLENQICLYIKFNSSTEAYNPLIASFVEQLIDSLRRMAENRCGGKLARPVHFILEELPQLPKISLGKTLAICRSQGILVTICIQSHSMLRAIYKEDTNGIFNNVSTTIILQSEDLETNKYYSELLGNYTVEVLSQSQTSNSANGSRTKSYSYQKVPLIAPDDLKQWGFDIGHLVLNKGKVYACSSLPVSKTFVGDMLGLNGIEPGDMKLGEFAPKRPIKNTKPAPMITWSNLDSSKETVAFAQAIDTASKDPRFF